MRPPSSSDDEVVEILLPIFTDEELASVAESVPNGERLVPLERVDRLPAAARAAAVESGRRSLRARGYIDDAGEPVQDRALAFVIGVRSSPGALVIAERISDRAKRVLYGQDEGGFLEERAEDGLHYFRLFDVGTAAAELASFADPESWARDDAPAVPAEDADPRWQTEVEATIAGADIVTRVFAIRRTGRDRTDEVVVYVAAQPDGVWVLSALMGDSSEAAVSAKKVSSTTLAGVMATCLRLEPVGAPPEEELD